MLKELLGKSQGREKAADAGAWDAPLQQLAREFVEEYHRTRDYERTPSQFLTGQQLLALPAAQQVELVTRLARLLVHPSLLADLLGREDEYWGRSILSKLAHGLLRRPLPWTEETVVALLEGLELSPDRWRSPVLSGVVRVLESWVESHGLPAALVAERQRWRAMAPTSSGNYDAAARKTIARFEAVLAQESGKAPTGSDAGLQHLNGEDLWALRLRALLRQAEPSAAPAWEALLAHAAKARGARPTGAWSEAVPERVAAVGFSALAALLAEVLPEVGKARPLRKDDWGMAARAFLVDERDADLLRGLVWCAGFLAEPRLDPILAQGVEVGYRSLPNETQTNSKFANACLYALSSQKRLEAVAELSRLSTRVRNANGRKEIDKALARAARGAAARAAALAGRGLARALRRSPPDGNPGPAADLDRRRGGGSPAARLARGGLAHAHR
jgi:hypothetical protein